MSTSTTDTSADYLNNPESDRNYPISGWVGGYNLVVPGGNTIDGFGLAITANDTSPLTVTNDGTIQINAGNTASAGSIR